MLGDILIYANPLSVDFIAISIIYPTKISAANQDFMVMCISNVLEGSLFDEPVTEN